MRTQEQPTRKIEIDFLYIDFDVCARRWGTDANLDAALHTVQAVLESTGAEVTVRKTLVDSEAKAMALGFLSSPTIRINGRDILVELRETPMIVDAILGAVYGSREDKPAQAVPASMPENPERFFTARTANANSACCSAQERSSCCDPAQQPACCAPPAGTAQAAGCGCR
jgi:hypothetical protein